MEIVRRNYMLNSKDWHQRKEEFEVFSNLDHYSQKTKQNKTKTNKKIETSPPLYTLTVLLHFHREKEDTQCRVQQEYIQNSTYQSPCCKEYLMESNERVEVVNQCCRVSNTLDSPSSCVVFKGTFGPSFYSENFSALVSLIKWIHIFILMLQSVLIKTPRLGAFRWASWNQTLSNHEGQNDWIKR